MEDKSAHTDPQVPSVDLQHSARAPLVHRTLCPLPICTSNSGVIGHCWQECTLTQRMLSSLVDEIQRSVCMHTHTHTQQLTSTDTARAIDMHTHTQSS